MRLSNDQIITLQLTKGIGAASINKICDAALKLPTELDFDGLYDLIDSMIQKRELVRVVLPEYDTFISNSQKAKRLISQSKALGISVVSRYDDNFPINLLATVDETGKASVPILMYYKGDLSITQKPAIAIIGTREPNADGLTAGRFLAKSFAEKGFNIVSGLALGCDTSGHEGALLADNGVTTAFLAHGLDTIYPKENSLLAERIVSNGGLLMSEYPIGEKVNRYNLVARDRLQAGLGDATLVIQTGVQGGTMHAVRATKAAGKPVYVAKYKNSSEKSSGNELLAAQGATWIDSKKVIDDIIEQLTNSKGDREDVPSITNEGTLFD